MVNTAILFLVSIDISWYNDNKKRGSAFMPTKGSKVYRADAKIKELLFDEEEVLRNYLIERGFACITDERLIVYEKDRGRHSEEEMSSLLFRSIQEVKLTGGIVTVCTPLEEYNFEMYDRREEDQFVRDLLQVASRY